MRSLSSTPSSPLTWLTLSLLLLFRNGRFLPITLAIPFRITGAIFIRTAFRWLQRLGKSTATFLTLTSYISSIGEERIRMIYDVERSNVNRRDVVFLLVVDIVCDFLFLLDGARRIVFRIGLYGVGSRTFL